jgi:hypothetical protein
MKRQTFDEVLQWFTGWSRGLPLEQHPSEKVWMKRINDLRAAHKREVLARVRREHLRTA